MVAYASPTQNKLKMPGAYDPAPGPIPDASAAAYVPGKTAPAPAPKANALAAKASPTMGSPYMQPKAQPRNALVADTIDGFMRGFNPEQYEKDVERRKTEGVDKMKKTLALIEQQRALPMEQRAQWWEANVDGVSEIMGQDMRAMPVDPNQFSDQALDGHRAMLSAQLGISPEKPEPMSAYEAEQIRLKELEAERAAGSPIKMGEDTLLDPKTYQPLYQAAPKPEKPPSWQTQEIGNRVIAYNPQNPGETMDMGPAPANSSGSGRGGLTEYQGLQFQFKLDDLDRELAEKERMRTASLASIDETLALATRFADKTDPSNQAKFDATYGNMMNPTGKKDDLLNWSIAMDDNRKDGMAILEQLGGSAFLDSIQAMKGSGSLSDAEGARVTAAATRLMTVNMTDDEARKAAADFIAKLTRYKTALASDLEKSRSAEIGRRKILQEMMGNSSSATAPVRPPPGVTQDLWDVMTEDERAEFAQ